MVHLQGSRGCDEITKTLFYKKIPRRPPALAGGRQRVIRAGIGFQRGQREALFMLKLFAVASVLGSAYPYI
jgi:hypothetical protein